jgi:ferredoxin
MKVEIFYFSGTGNSLAVARDLSESLGGRLCPIAARMSGGMPGLDAELIGLVFPVYYAGLPPIVRRFAENLEMSSDTYLFAVVTYGGGIGNTVRELRAALPAGPRALSAAFGAHMPQNAFYKPWENRQKIFSAWKRKKEKIATAVQSRRRGMLLGDAAARTLLHPVGKAFEPRTRRFLSRISGTSRDEHIDDLIHGADHEFRATENCNGCGICSQICPVENIKLVEYRPVWQHRCENCIACYTWCPQQAIVTSIIQEGYRYHHPDVTLSDMLSARHAAEE